MKIGFHSLKLKMVLINIIILVVILSTSYYINFYYTNRIIFWLLDDFIGHLSDATKNSLELAMVTKNKEKLNEILKNIHSDREIHKIFIIDNDRRIKFSSDSIEINQIVDIGGRTSDLTRSKSQTFGTRSELITSGHNEVYLRNINPILKKPQCSACHSTDQPILGNLIIDFSLEFFKKHQASLRHAFIILTIATSIILIILINILIHRFLLNRLSSINSSIKTITDGNFKERIKITGRDEIDSVSASFNEMIEKVNTLMGEVQKDKTYLEHLINSVDDGIMVINVDYTIALANNALLKKKGLSSGEVVGQYCHKLKSNQNIPCSTSDHNCPLNKIKLTGKPVKTIHMIPAPGEGYLFFEISASPMKNEQGELVQIIEVIRDISERKNLEAQLIQSEKLASIGILTTNVAHEINNPMASITTCVEGLLKRLKTVKFQESEIENTFGEYLETIKNAAFRCKIYTERLLSFSSPSKLEVDIININDILNDITALIKHQAQSNGKAVVLNLSDNLPFIKGDRTQLAQVFLNLITNGLDATNANGKVTVRSEQNKEEVKISIQDDGYGIDERIYKKIFEPFFTTKEKGKGTGLGLYISQQVIEKHGGHIEVKNLFPSGAEFTVFIPCESTTSNI